MDEHIYDIKNFIPYEKHFTSVAIHFNLRNHQLSDLQFYILYNKLDDKILRLFMEAKLIHFFKENFATMLINRKFPDVFALCSKILI